MGVKGSSREGWSRGELKGPVERDGVEWVKGSWREGCSRDELKGPGERDVVEMS